MEIYVVGTPQNGGAWLVGSEAFQHYEDAKMSLQVDRDAGIDFTSIFTLNVEETPQFLIKRDGLEMTVRCEDVESRIKSLRFVRANFCSRGEKELDLKTAFLLVEAIVGPVKGEN